MIYAVAFLILVGGITYASLKRGGALIALAICMFGVESFFASKSVFFVNHGSFANFVIAGAIAFRCFISFTRGQLVNPVSTLTFRYSGLLLALAIFSYVWTPEQEQFLDNWKKGAPYILIYLLLVPMMMSSMDVARTTLLWTLAIGAAVTVLLYTASDWDGRGVVLAGQSRFADKRDTAAVLAIAQLGGAVAIIAALIKIERRRWVNIARWAIVLMGLLIVVRTGSRGQTLAAVGCITAFVPLHSRSMSIRGVITVFGSIAVVGFIAYYLYLEYGNTGRWQYSQVALIRRTEMWVAMFNQWTQGGPIPWMVGLGNASAYLYVGFYIHNVPLEILCEEGLVGFVLYVLLVKRVLSNGYLALRAGERMEPFRFNVLVIFTALFTYEVLLTLKSGSLHYQQLFMLYGIAIEVALRGWQNDFDYVEYAEDFDGDLSGLEHEDDTEFENFEEYDAYGDELEEEYEYEYDAGPTSRGHSSPGTWTSE